MELPEQRRTQAYQGPQLYSAEYVLQGITALKAKVIVLTEMALNLRGRLQLQESAFHNQLKQIGSGMVEHMLRLDAPTAETAKDGKPEVIDAEEV